MVDVVIVRQRMSGMTDDDLANLIRLEWSQMRREKTRQQFIFEIEKADPEKIDRVLTIISNLKEDCHMASLAYDLLEAKYPGVY